MLFLDLDVLIVGALDPIVEFPASLALTEDAVAPARAGDDRDRYGRRRMRRFNSSVIVWEAAAGTAIFERWTPAVAETLSTDQDWIAAVAPEAAAMPLAWFPRISQVHPPWPDDATVVLCKKPKNAEAIRRWPELAAWWGSGKAVA